MTWIGARAFLRHELADALVVLDWSLSLPECDAALLRGAQRRASLVLAGLRLIDAAPGDRERALARFLSLLPSTGAGHAVERADLWAMFLSEAAPGLVVSHGEGVLHVGASG